MSHISEMADELATEVLTEAAETFFGQRKELESELDLFQQRVKVLAETGQKVFLAQKIMHKILINEAAIQNFYQTMGLRIPERLEIAEVCEVASQMAKPFAWTLRGGFIKLLLMSYDRLYNLAQEYLHGGYRADPMNPRRKIAVFGYAQLQEWSQRINQKVIKMNTQQAPSEVLQFFKGLDVQGSAMEKSIGASCAVDRNDGLLFPLVDFQTFCLPVFPELPLPADIRRRLQFFCKALFSRKSPEIRALFQELAAMWGETV